MENGNTNKKTISSYEKYRIMLIQYSIALNNIKVPTQIIYILITIQALQLISMGLITPLHFQSLGLYYFGYVAQVLYPDYYLRNTQLVLYLIPITFIVTLTHILIVIFTIRIESRLKIIALYLFLLFNTIFLIPFLHANVSILSCSTASPFSHSFTCYEGYHIFYLLLSCLNILWSIFCTFFVFALCTKSDPLCTDFYATSFNLWILAKFLLKISPIIYINVDPQLKFDVLYSVSFAGINLVYTVAFKLMWPQHRNYEKIQNFVIRAQMITIFVTAFLIALHFFKDDPLNLSFLLSWILGLIFSEIVIEFFRFKKENLIRIYLQNSSQQQQINEQTYIKFFYTLIQKIEQTSLDGIQTLHIIKLHQVDCQIEECCCHEIQQIYENLETGMKLSKELIYRFVNVLIKQASAKLKKNNMNLLIASAYISYYRLNEKIISINNMSELLKSNKITLSQEISIRRLFLDFKNLDKSLTDLNKYIEFSQNLWYFQRQAEAAAQNCKKYWNYLIEQDCSTLKVWKLANVVQNDKEKLKKLVHSKLLSIFPNNVHSLKLYSDILSFIYQASPESIKQYEQACSLASNQVSDHVKMEEELCFRENQQIAVMCAAESDGIFSFLRVSSNVINILSIRNVDLIQKNINTIMPEIYQQFHDKRVKKYFNSNDTFIKQRNSKVFPISKEGNVVSCYYKAKIISSMDHGLELVCFLRRSNAEKNEKFKNYYLIYYFKKGVQQEDSQFRNGDILHIEPGLKNLLFPPENQKDDAYVTKIEQVLPEWDIDHQKMIDIQSDISFNKIHKIEIEHEDELDEGVMIKYLSVEVRKEKCRFTLQQFSLSDMEVEKKKKAQSSIKECLYAQTSQSRLIFMEGNEKIESVQPNRLQDKPLAIPHFIMSVATLVIVGIVTMLCFFQFQIAPTYQTVQAQEFAMIETINQLGFGLIESSLKIQKSLDPLLSDNKTSIKVMPYDIDALNNKMKNIYSFLGIQSVDSSITVLMRIYQNNALAQVSALTINNAVSFLTNTMSQLVTDLNDENSKLNLFRNLEQTYKSINQISDICSHLSSQRFQTIRNREITCSSVQLSLILALFVAGVVRIVKISDMSESTIQIYQSSMDTYRLKEFVFKCNIFIDKIRGVENPNQNLNLEQVRTILMQFQHYVPVSNAKPVSPKRIENEKGDEQQQKLINLKRKVTFHRGPSKLYYIILGFMVIACWLALKLALKFQTLFLSVQTFRVGNRTQIRNCLELNGDIQRLTFHLALNQSDSEFDKTLTLTEKKLAYITEFNESKSSVNFEEVFKVLSELKAQKQETNFMTIEETLNKGQIQLIDYAHKRIKKESQTADSLKSPQIMAAQIILGIAAVIAFWQLMVVQEQIRAGCTLMLEMVKDRIGGEQYRQRFMKASQIF